MGISRARVFTELKNNLFVGKTLCTFRLMTANRVTPVNIVRERLIGTQLNNQTKTLHILLLLLQRICTCACCFETTVEFLMKRVFAAFPKFLNLK